MFWRILKTKINSPTAIYSNLELLRWISWDAHLVAAGFDWHSAASETEERWSKLPLSSLGKRNNDNNIFVNRQEVILYICQCRLFYLKEEAFIGSDNSLSPGRRQAIWTNAGTLLIWPSGTNFSEFLIEIQTFSLTKIRLKMCAKCCPFRLGLNVLQNNT